MTVLFCVIIGLAIGKLLSEAEFPRISPWPFVLFGLMFVVLPSSWFLGLAELTFQPLLSAIPNTGAHP